MRFFITKANSGSNPDSITPTKFGAGEANSVFTELTNTVTKSGLTPANASGDGEDTTQLAQSVFITSLKGQSFDTYGTADAIVLVPKGGVNGLMLPPSYAPLDGAVILFTASFANTGPVTIGLGQNPSTTIGVKGVFLNGSPLSGGELVAGENYRVSFSGLSDRFDLVTSSFSLPIYRATLGEAQAGTTNEKVSTPFLVAAQITAGLATSAEAIAGTNNSKLMTPLRVAEAIPTATNTTAGKSRRATDAEALAKVATDPFITPSQIPLIMPSYMIVEERFPSGTPGGSVVAGVWTRRNLNYIQSNGISGASLSGGVVSLPSGKYFITASAPANSVNNHKITIRNVDTLDVLLVGTSESVNVVDDVATTSVAQGVVTIASLTRIEVVHRVNSSGRLGTYALGAPASFGVDEIYSQLTVTRL